jgi:DNA repair photolyase
VKYGVAVEQVRACVRACVFCFAVTLCRQHRNQSCGVFSVS